MVDQNVQRYECCEKHIEDREEKERRNQLTHKIALKEYEGRQHNQNPFEFSVILQEDTAPVTHIPNRGKKPLEDSGSLDVDDRCVRSHPFFW